VVVAVVVIFITHQIIKLELLVVEVQEVIVRQDMAQVHFKAVR
jgi:hypothetical protein